jgi:hypothetical protein
MQTYKIQHHDVPMANGLNRRLEGACYNNLVNASSIKNATILHVTRILTRMSLSILWSMRDALYSCSLSTSSCFSRNCCIVPH